MICVSIGRSRHRHMIAEHRHMVSQGAELVELRLDYLSGDVRFRELLDNRPGPVLVTCRRERDGGKYNGSEESRLSMLRMAIAEGVEYVDIEEDVADQIARYGKTKRVISHHDFQRTPTDLSAIHARMSMLDPDIVKIATLANTPSDNIQMRDLMQSTEIPTIGICMGEIGTPSRVLAGKFGAPFTYATFHAERSLAPGQLSFSEMREIYHYDQIKADTAVYAVIGDPIAHSHSPLIHNAAFHAIGMNAVYLPMRIRSEHLEAFLQDAPRMGICGISITIPHKEAVAKLLKQVDRVIVGTGAANTLLFSPTGMVGYNTDSRAAIDSLAMRFPDGEESLEGKTVLILGAGGAAKAVAFSLRNRGAEVVISSRTQERAQKLTEQIECRAVSWKSRHGIDCSILINCTPVGMHPNVDSTPFDRHYLKPSMTVLDTVYNPENTLLIKDARSQGCVTVTGTEMFVRQAALQFRLFSGVEPPEELMRETLRRSVGAVNV
ncbi:MAG: shikimate dehydrogenase [Planctomycetota bacterium]|nr:shikimate dehydrogenase [Planctomycetota bacterium]MEC8337648.1 shikimate dehydrogenase [Planctomycetota bacterium]